MARHILKCVKCGAYTMKEEHCGEKTVTTKPAKYSPDDKYKDYRRKAKRAEMEEKGLV